MSERFDFTEQFAYGEEAERYAAEVVGPALTAGETEAEIKRKTRVDLQFYVETEQHSLHGRGPWVDSGINVATGPFYCFVLADTGILIALPTASVRKAVDRSCGTLQRQPQLHNGNPTRGRLIHLSDFFHMRPWPQEMDTCNIPLAWHCRTGGEHLDNYFNRCKEHGTNQ